MSGTAVTTEYENVIGNRLTNQYSNAQGNHESDVQ